MENVMSFGMDSKLRLPTYFVDVTNSEMEYLDGGWSLSAFGQWLCSAATSGAVALGAGLGISAGVASGGTMFLVGHGVGAVIIFFWRSCNWRNSVFAVWMGVI